ncbi:hypothetical protein RHECNPAF_14110033 [Rhizobium etli CNPAF512]|nr:hypothetical protein RHECNPAF_14110033 [Rhizobium etli CNPAF512]
MRCHDANIACESLSVNLQLS